jgi:hypothetical protein
MSTLNCIYKGLRKFWACEVVVILLLCLLANELRYYLICFRLEFFFLLGKYLSNPNSVLDVLNRSHAQTSFQRVMHMVIKI